MAEYTQNFNLIKPGQEDFYNVENFNNNADIIDAELKKLENNKVDKVEGKQLSTEDYTTEEKQKLAGIEEGANKYTHPKTHSANIITENENRRFVSDVEKANWDSKETPEGAQAKANAAASSALAAANSYTDQEVGALAGEGNVKTVKQLDDDLAAHKAESATNAHLPRNVGLDKVDNVKQMPISGGVLENYREKLLTLSGTSATINLNNGNVFTHTLSGNTTYSITNAQSQAHSFTLIITQTGTVRTITFPSSVKWQGGEIPDMSTANKTYVLTFMTINGGTTWLGMFGGEF